MKLAYMATAKIPSREASSIHVMKICSAIANANAQENAVTLVVPEYSDKQLEQGVGNVFEYYGVPGNFCIKRISTKLPGLHFLKGMRRAFKTARYVCGGGFDCIYGRDVKTCFFIAAVFHKPVIFEHHTSFEANRTEDRYFRMLIRSEYFVKMVVITDALKQYFISHYDLDAEKIYIAPDGADAPDESHARAELTGKSKGRFHVGYIGHLYKGRGLELLGDIAAACTFAFFHIIGGNEKDIAFWKEKYGSAENIHFYGFIPPAQTAGYGKQMDVLIAPYQEVVHTAGGSTGAQGTARWMSPLKIFEYMALEKPIITSDMPVLKEVMKDGYNGILCPASDAQAWSAAIKRLFEDKQLSQMLAGNAARDFEKYTWAARAENLLKELDRI